MKTGEKLFKFLASLMLRRFYGTITIRLEAGKATHVETETKWIWRHEDLPLDTDHEGPGVANSKLL